MKMELENLLKIIDAVSESELTGLKYEENDMKLHLTKKGGKVQVVTAETQAVPAPAAVPAAPQAAAEEAKIAEPEAEGKIVKSPLVGTFYAAPSEGADPFVSVGDVVKKGQTLAIVEAMKLMNEIESEFDGTVAEILVENAKPVEYGQPLFRIK